jgi:hypothetical protein
MRQLAARACYLTRQWSAFLTFSGILATPLASQQNDPSVCNAALAKDRLQILRTGHQRYAYLNRIDRETYEQLKKDIEAGLTIPGVDVFIKASASYNAFVERRERFFQEMNYTADLAYEEYLLQLVTEPVAYTAFAACMEQFAKQHVGFYAWKTMDRPDGIVADYYWHAPFGAKSARAVSEITGGSARDAPKGRAFPPGKRFQPNEGGTLEIRGNPGASTLLATIGARGYSTHPLRSLYRLGAGPIGTVMLRLTFATEREVGPREMGVTSGNNRNVACGNAPHCSPGRKWRASLHELTLDAGEGHVFRGAHVHCVGMPPDLRAAVEELKSGNPQERTVATAYESVYAHVCAFSQVVQAPVDGARTINAQVLSWTRPTHFVLRATVVEPQSTVDTTQRFTIGPGQTVIVRVPSSASSAVILARACGGETAATPGETSRDRRLLDMGKVGIGDEIAYLYRYEAPRGPDGGMLRACGLPGVTGVNAFEAAVRFNERYDAERPRP